MVISLATIRRTAATVLALPLLVAPSALAQTPEASETSRIDSLNQANLQEAFRLLRKSYIQRDTLTHEELNRAALQGLLARLDFGAELISREKSEVASESATKLHSEMITETVGYIRPATWAAEEVAAIDEALTTFATASAQTLLLDFRSPAPHGEFTVAAQIADRFTAAGETLFSLKRSGKERPQLFQSKSKPAWEKNVVCLVDEDTNNVGETVAAVLKSKLSLFLVGAQTSGRTAQYQEVVLGKENALRFAVAEVELSDGTSIYRKGLTPDLLVPSLLADKNAIFAKVADEKSIKEFVFEEQRPRFNEAALVAGTNPELGYELAKSSGKESPYDSRPLQDRVLQQAIDLVSTTAFLAPKIERKFRPPAVELPPKEEEEAADENEEEPDTAEQEEA